MKYENPINKFGCCWLVKKSRCWSPFPKYTVRLPNGGKAIFEWRKDAEEFLVKVMKKGDTFAHY